MAKLSILAGATSQSVNVFIQDSSSTVGAGLGGLVFNSGSLIAYYTFTGANATATAITLATLAAVNSAFSSGGFKEIDATHMKGLYRLDIPNAALASASGQSVTIILSGAANMAPCVLEIELTAWNNQDGVHGGLSSLPNTAVTTNASLLTSGTGTDQLSVTSGIAQANVEQWDSVAIAEPATDGIPDVNVKNWANVAQSVSATNFPKTDVTSWLGTTVATPATGGVPDINVKNIGGSASAGVAGAVAPDWSNILNKTSVVDLTNTTIKNLDGNTVQTGDAFARLGAPAGASVSADIAAIKTDLDAGVTVATIASTATQLKKNVASQGPLYFLMTDNTNHNPDAGLTITATISKDGGALAAPGGTVTAVSNGLYYFSPSQADTNCKFATLRFTAAAADDTWLLFQTTP
jgi:hypothetical protein